MGSVVACSVVEVANQLARLACLSTRNLERSAKAKGGNLVVSRSSLDITDVVGLRLHRFDGE